MFACRVGQAVALRALSSATKQNKILLFSLVGSAFLSSDTSRAQAKRSLQPAGLCRMVSGLWSRANIWVWLCK